MSEVTPPQNGFVPELSTVLLTEHTVGSLLDLVVEVAPVAVSGVDGASVSVMGDRDAGWETSNASSAWVRRVDEVQYGADGGPCVEAARVGLPVHFLTRDDRWPVYSEAARASGVRSVRAEPLRVGDNTIGALNLYSLSSEDDWTESQVSAARVLAGQAAVLLANAAAHASAELMNSHLRRALDTRTLIGQATGLIMARQRMTAEEAFTVLRHGSQRAHRKLRDLAGDIVEAAERQTDDHE